jgi:hypothetical protein
METHLLLCKFRGEGETNNNTRRRAKEDQSISSLRKGVDGR